MGELDFSSVQLLTRHHWTMKRLLAISRMQK